MPLVRDFKELLWLDFALKCGYIDSAPHSELYKHYEQISGGLIKMIAEPDAWCGPAAIREEGAEYNVSLTGDSDMSDETGT